MLLLWLLLLWFVHLKWMREYFYSYYNSNCLNKRQFEIVSLVTIKTIIITFKHSNSNGHSDSIQQMRVSLWWRLLKFFLQSKLSFSFSHAYVFFVQCAQCITELHKMSLINEDTMTHVWSYLSTPPKKN